MHASLATVLAATSTKSSGSPYGTIVILVIIVAVGYFFLIRPARRRQRGSAQARASIEVGAEVLTTSGMLAKVIDVEDDHVTLEIAPGVRSRFLAQAVVRTVTPAEGSTAEGVGPDAPAPVVPMPVDAAPEDAQPPHEDAQPPPEDSERPPPDDSVRPA